MKLPWAIWQNLQQFSLKTALKVKKAAKPDFSRLYRFFTGLSHFSPAPFFRGKSPPGHA